MALQHKTEDRDMMISPKIIMPIAPEVKIVEVTPAMATDFLSGNNGNRALRKDKIAQYAEEMRAGRWLLNGEGLTFVQRGDGTLWCRNGQHRLHAVVNSGCTIRTVMTTLDECDPACAHLFETFDQQTQRSLRDLVAASGRDYDLDATSVSTGVNAVALANIVTSDLTATTYRHLSKFAKMEMFLEDVAIGMFAGRFRRSWHTQTHRNVGAGMLAGVVISCRADLPAASAFWGDVLSGTNLAADAPAFALRERLIRSGNVGDARLAADWCALTVRAWNRHARGERTTDLLLIDAYKGRGERTWRNPFVAVRMGEYKPRQSMDRPVTVAAVAR